MAALQPAPRVRTGALDPLSGPKPPSDLRDIMPDFRPASAVPAVDYEKLISVLTSKHTCNMFDRHVAILEKLAKVLRGGVEMQDFQFIGDIFMICREKILSGAAILECPVVRILSACRNMRLDTNEACENRAIANFLSSITALLCLKNLEICEIVSEIIVCLAGGASTDLDADGRVFNKAASLNNSPPIMLDKIKTKSNTANDEWIVQIKQSDTVMNLARALETQKDLQSRRTMLRTVRRLSTYQTLCHEIIYEGLLEIIADIMRETNDSSILNLGIDILWNSLSLDGFASGTLLASFREGSGIYPTYHMTTIDTMFGQEDYQLKRLLVFAFTWASGDPGTFQYLLENGIMGSLMPYLAVHREAELLKRWSPQQLEGIQIQTYVHQKILGFIRHNISRLANVLESSQGYSVLIDFLERAVDRSCHKMYMPGVEDLLQLVPTVLRTILSISGMGSSHRVALGELGVWPQLLRIIKCENYPPEVWRITLLLCSSLGSSCDSNKRLFGSYDGVEALIPFLKFHSADPQEREAVLFSVIECIWGAVCGDQLNEDAFFKSRGVYLMLDLLERSSHTLQQHILGTLLDLMENPKTRMHAMEWRTVADVKKTLVHFLIDLWQKEELILGVQQNAQGIIEDTVAPLMGDIHAKIYSLFCKLGFEYGSDILNVREQVQLSAISKFLDFKIGEVWNEIAAELDWEGTYPVSPDMSCVRAAKMVITEKAKAVQQQQIGLIEQNAEHRRNEEDQFYQSVKERNSMKHRTQFTGAATDPILEA
ncbi:armadillo-type protein [Polychytrium aggregatum]|uniref:armadillo-type protein n=1 Tax=Polychytrium aggregatum TaxID=110093 RepID=UPI0022FE357B|nr:armadillo-type protein [Polychytrium aggregatum]KAI9206078.1 armadillo-type protein [Polychytrium aggregatum]